MNKLEKAGYRARKKSEFFMNQTEWLGGIKPNEEKVEAISKKPNEKHKRTEILSRSNTIHSEIHTETLGKNGQTPETTEKE